MSYVFFLFLPSLKSEGYRLEEMVCVHLFPTDLVIHVYTFRKGPFIYENRKRPIAMYCSISFLTKFYRQVVMKKF